MTSGSSSTAPSPSSSSCKHVSTQEDAAIVRAHSRHLLPPFAIRSQQYAQCDLVWNGIIFVRQGYFKDARLKFTLHLHHFPAKQPQLFFSSKLHHALVNPVTNELDVSSTLADMWSYYSDSMLYNFMKDLKKIFTDKQRLANRFSFNPPAAELYETNAHEYITKAMQSVSDSLEKLQENDEDWSLKVGEPNEETG